MSAPTIPELTEQVRTALAKQFGTALDSVADTAMLREALGERYDSLAALECICNIESAFGIEVDFVEDDVRHFFSTIKLICEFVRDRMEDLAVLAETSTAKRA